MKNCKFCVVLAAVMLLMFCEISSAAEFTSYFRIAREYAEDSEKAIQTWTGKEITVEGNVLVSGPDNNQNLVIGLAAESVTLPFKNVVYGFIFSGVPEESSAITKGYKVRVSGKVTEIKKELWDNDNVLTITAEASKLIQAQAAEFTHFFRIPDDADMNYEAAQRTWMGKRINIEGQILNLHVDNERNYIAVNLYAKSRILPSIDEVGYMFFFVNPSDEVRNLKEGQTVRASGKVYSIDKSDKVLMIGLDSSLLLF